MVLLISNTKVVTFFPHDMIEFWDNRQFRSGVLGKGGEEKEEAVEDGAHSGGGGIWRWQLIRWRKIHTRWRGTDVGDFVRCKTSSWPRHTSWVWAAHQYLLSERRSNCPKSLRSNTTRLLRSRSYTASCWLRTKHQEKTLPVSAEPPCTPFIPRKETGNGLVRACTHTKCCFCRDLQKCIQIIVPCAHAQCTPCKNTMHTGCL